MKNGDSWLRLGLLLAWSAVVASHAQEEVQPIPRRWDISATTRPAVGPDGTVYAGAKKSLLALDPRTKQVLWRFRPPGLRYHLPNEFWNWGTPILGRDGNLVITLRVRDDVGTYMTMYALDAASGEVRWQGKSWHYIEQPVIGNDGTVYVSGELNAETGLRALDRETGRILWDQPITLLVGGPVIGPDGSIYMQDKEEGRGGPVATYVYEAQSGELLERRAHAVPFFAQDGTILDTDTPMRALAPHSGQILWSTYLGENLGMVLDGGDGWIYVSESRNVHALDLETGETLWDILTGSQTPAYRPSLALSQSGTLYVTQPDRMIGVDAATGKQNSRFVHPGRSQQITLSTDGSLYLSDYGLLTALSADGPMVDAPFAPNNPNNFQRGGPPEILGLTSQLALEEGGAGILAVFAGGDPPLRYQWFFDGQPIEDANKRTIEIANFTSDLVGDYQVTVSNESGRVQSGTIPVGFGFALTTKVRGPGGIRLDPPGGRYLPGTTVTAKAVPDQPLGFFDWSGDVSSKETSVTIIMNQPWHLTASFQPAPGTMIWEKKVDQFFSNGVLEIDRKGTIYTTTSISPGSLSFVVLKAVDPVGKVLWESEHGTGGSDPALVVGDDDTVYIGLQGSVTALNAVTGEERWTKSQLDTPWITMGIGVSNSGIVYAANDLPLVSGNRGISGFVLDGKSGEIVWEYPKGSSTEAIHFAIDENDKLFAANLLVRAFDGTTGEGLWNIAEKPRPPAEDDGWYTSTVRFGPMALGINNTLYGQSRGWVGTLEGKHRLTICHAWNQETGEELWNYPHQQAYARSGKHSIGADGTVYFPSGSTLLSLDGLSGELNWEIPHQDLITSPVIDSDGVVYCAAGNQVHAYAPDTGATLWTFRTPNEKAIDANVLGPDGTLYIMAFDTLYAVRTASQATPQWPSESGPLPFRRWAPNQR